MSKQLLVGIIALLIVLGGSAFAYTYLNESPSPATPSNTVTTPAPVKNTAPSTPTTTTTSSATTSTSGATQVSQEYTLSEVAAHSKNEDCWSAVSGMVYNLTSWGARHPGGKESIQGMCGKDASAGFEGAHDGQPRPEKMLESFKIGTLKK